ncbi:PIN domain-containing protein [bacterium]|nr:PIN domain-containing protein [bacterium]
MLSDFPGFVKLTEEQNKQLWGNCTFIFDTNFLLNLYRHPHDARDEVITILESIKERIWIPNQVALEYHRNRHKIISDQKIKFQKSKDLFSELKNELNKKIIKDGLKRLHPFIDYDKYCKMIDDFISKIHKELDDGDSRQPDIFNEDDILIKLTELFGDNVGAPISTQKELDDIFKEGENRYRLGIPPGFRDKGKEKDKDSASYSYGGLIMKKKFGDLLIWHQIKEFAKLEDIKFIIFVTDEKKDDWWYEVSGKTIGPRPELVDEIERESHVSLFHMYNTEQFLKQSKKELKTNISDQSISSIGKAIDAILIAMEDEADDPESQFDNILCDILVELTNQLINCGGTINEEVCSTNATGYGLDTYDLISYSYNKRSKSFHFKSWLFITGDQIDDKMYCGSRISVLIDGFIHKVADSWVLADYEILKYEVE